jgi:hypothetical protein
VRVRLALLLALVFVISGYSCNRRGSKFIKEGEINYSVNYVGELAVPVEFLPKNLTVTFKDDKILFELLSPYGKAGITNLVNPENEIYDTYYSFFSRKYYYPASPEEIFPGFSSMEGLQIIKTDKTAVICGFNCRNAEIIFPDRSSQVYNIWYTDEIGLPNSNASNPFNSIDGVLLSFFFRLGDTELHFEAESVYRRDVPDKIFERRKSFKKVSRDDINKFITAMISL